MEVLFRYFTKLFSQQLKVRPVFDIFVTSEGIDETSHPYSLNRDLVHSLLPMDNLCKNIFDCLRTHKNYGDGRLICQREISRI